MAKQTFDQMLAREVKPTYRNTFHDEEHRIQSACVRWFRYQYQDLSKALFAVPNGANKSKTARTKFKEEGLLSGVADLILLVPNRTYHALLIEMKTRTGRQEPSQKEWQEAIEPLGYRYVICRSLDEFMGIVNDYLKTRL